MSFLGEIKRRKVFQVAAVYAVMAWLIVQIVATIEGPLSLPNWFDTAVIVALAIGFPIAVVLAWAFNLTPDGVVRDEGGVSTQRSGRRIEVALFGLLVVAVGWIGFRELNPPAPDSGGILPNSVAVLPLENLSVNPEYEFFAAGIHDTILNELAQIADMNVIARTSVLRYADGQTPIAQIAEELNVETVMEGTVQYAEGQVRITAQLIDPATGSHIWSGNYDRNFADIFVIQSEIAERIAMALEAELSPAEQERIELAPTTSATAYALYLQALSIEIEPTLAIDYLDRAIALDSSFALAYAMKARILGFRYVRDVTEALERAPETAAAVAEERERTVMAAAEQALELDPNLGLAHAAVGVMNLRRWRKDEAEEAFSRAVALSPNDPEVLRWYSYFLSFSGQHDGAIEALQRVVQIDPENSMFDLAEAYFLAREYEASATIHRRLLADDDPETGNYRFLAEVETATGNYAEALENLQIQEQFGIGQQPGPHARVAYAYSRGGRPDDAMRLFLSMQERSPSFVQQAVGSLAIGDHAEALRLFRRAAENEFPLPGATLLMIVKLNLYDDPVLDQPEFVEVRSRLGFRE